jgi:hypothetical protein
MCHAGTTECSQLVHGSFGHQLITNNSTGTPIETDLLYGADQLDVRAVLDDTAIVPTITFADDSFSFPRTTSDESYSLSIRAAQEATVFNEVQDSGDNVALWAPYYGRISRSGVTRVTDVNVMVTGVPPPTRAYIASTGLRSYTYVDAQPANTQMFTFDWNMATSLYGAQGVLSAAAGDVLWYNGLDETIPSMDPVDDYYAIVSQMHQMVTMTNGGTLSFTGAASATPQDHCVTLGLPRSTELARVQASTPFATSTTGSGWSVAAVPFASVGPGAAIPIVIQANGTIEDQSIKIIYANPYPEDQIASMSAAFRRSALATGATTGVSLSYGTSQMYQVPSSPTATCAAITMNANIAMPSPLTLGGTLLDTDNQMLEIDRSGPISLEFAPIGGVADDWITLLDEVTVVAGVTTVTELRQYSTLTPSVIIDPKLLISGRSYLFETYARVGFPNAATRDYKTVAYPFGTGVVYSSIFTIGN